MPARAPIVVMGPSGAGKSTVGAALADVLGARFVDGDDLHPAENIAKMSAGIPLEDADREPWLDRIGEVLAAEPPVVIACSALRRAYRDAIRRHAPDAFFVELVVPPEELRARLRKRGDHFMPPELLPSQLDILEPLGTGERGGRFDASPRVEQTLAEIISALEAPACR